MYGRAGREGSQPPPRTLRLVTYLCNLVWCAFKIGLQGGLKLSLVYTHSMLHRVYILETVHVIFHKSGNQPISTYTFVNFRELKVLQPKINVTCN